MGYRMDVLPIARSTNRDVAQQMVATLVAQTSEVSVARSRLIDWLKYEFGLTKVSRDLVDVTALGPEEFVTAVRATLPNKQKLTAAQLAELRREHAATIEPARLVRAEIFDLERKLSDLVNEAYGLTPDEVALMWRTAPPRMPFTPAGFQSAENGIDDDNDAEE